MWRSLLFWLIRRWLYPLLHANYVKNIFCWRFYSLFSIMHYIFFENTVIWNKYDSASVFVIKYIFFSFIFSVNIMIKSKTPSICTVKYRKLNYNVWTQYLGNTCITWVDVESISSMMCQYYASLTQNKHSRDILRFYWKVFDSQLTWCQSDSYSLRFDLNGIKPWTSIRKSVVLWTSIIHPQKIKKALYRKFTNIPRGMSLELVKC